MVDIKTLNTIFKNLETDQNFLLENKVCEICGKPYVHKYVEIKCTNAQIHCYEPDCNCKEIEKEKRQQEEHSKKMAEFKAKKLKALFEKSGLPPRLQEETFYTLDANYNSEQLESCINFANNFIPKNSNGIQLIGNIGNGKTAYLAAICNQLIQQGYNCLFITFSDLLEKFCSYSAEHFGDVTRLLDWLKEYDFIVLDDIGRETYTDKRKELAFRIIDTLLNHKTVIGITANPENIGKLSQIDEWKATIDRLRDMCKIKLEFRQQSYRGNKH